MTDLLNETERSFAASIGWVVCWVWCLDRQRAVVQVLPTPSSPIKSADMLQRAVSVRAAAGDTFAQRVMALILNPPPYVKKAKRK